MSVRETVLTLTALPLETKDIILQATLVEKDNAQPIPGQPILWRKFNPPTQDWTTLVTTVTDDHGKTILPLYVQGQWALIPLAEKTTFSCWHPNSGDVTVIYLASTSNSLDIEPPKPPPTIPWMAIGIVAAVATAAGVGYYFLVYRKKHKRQYTPLPPPSPTPTYGVA
mgnify:CR=1 FL=1